jgi:hypothetical protein
MPLESKVAISVNRVCIISVFYSFFVRCGVMRKGRHNFLGESNKLTKNARKKNNNNGRTKKESAS